MSSAGMLEVVITLNTARLRNDYQHHLGMLQVYCTKTTSGMWDSSIGNYGGPDSMLELNVGFTARGI